MKSFYPKLGLAMLVISIITWVTWPATEKRLNSQRNREARLEIRNLYELLLKQHQLSGEFPDSLATITNHQEFSEQVLDKYLYWPPTKADLKEPGFDKIILAEKLGHYLFRNGGYVVFMNGANNWIDEKNMEYYIRKMGSAHGLTNTARLQNGVEPRR